jgi:hypothetical protein
MDLSVTDVMTTTAAVLASFSLFRFEILTPSVLGAGRKKKQ